MGFLQAEGVVDGMAVKVWLSRGFGYGQVSQNEGERYGEKQDFSFY